MLGRRGANKRLLGGLLTMVGMAAARGTGQAQAPHPKVPANFPYPVHWIPGSNALSEWERLRHLGPGWPVVVGDAEALELLSQSLVPADRPAPAAVLQAASKLHHPQSLFDHRRKELDAVRAYAKPGEIIEDDPQPEVGEWPLRAETAPILSTAIDILSGKPLDRVAIVVLPTKFGWEVPAYLNWGGWNANPPPEVHVAALRAWHERYGATLVGLGGDAMNLRVSRRPKSREEALALSREHYAYCQDIVDQGVETLSALAASHLESDWWYFWWD